ncbi:MAG: hypothetical protein A2202_01170 [Bdellovibrionales bacterium RIFOXYA1_FULL_36_14]|nr:MAG: hypothetical protein A2202_01170 [Bdellovibrionales bacterium RIFOXYA1_FULL_36_14]
MIFSSYGSDDFMMALELEDATFPTTALNDKTINCLQLSYDADEKIASVIRYINEKGEFILSEEPSARKSLERINQKFKKDELLFKMETGFSVGLSTLVVYLKRQNLLSLAKYTGVKTGQLATFISNGITGHPALGPTLTFLSALTFTYFYKSELSDGTLLAHYINHLDNFLELPQDVQIDFIINCQRIDQRIELCNQFEQKIIALDQFITAAIDKKIEQDSFERLMKKIDKE